MGRFGLAWIIQTKQRKLPLKPAILIKQAVDPKKLILTVDVLFLQWLWQWVTF